MITVLKYVFYLTITLLLLGVIYEQYAAYMAVKKFPLNGKMIDVGGQKLHVVKQGDAARGVVFESGLDMGGHLSWSKVQGRVSEFATTLSYDRGGILRSEESDKPRTCQNMAEALNKIIQKSGIPKPYILVGHSFGGLLLRCYVDKYRDEVAGVIFVDSAQPKQFDKLPKRYGEMAANVPSAWFVKLGRYSGAVRIYTQLFKPQYPATDSNDEINLKSQAFTPSGYEATIGERKSFFSISKQAEGIDFGEIPLRILVANKNQDKEMLPAWKQLQKDALGLSKNSKMSLIDSGHYIQLEQPDAVVKAIREILQ